MCRNNTEKQVAIWRQVATVGAFLGLFLLAWTSFFGFETYRHILAACITSVFFTCSVIWWFWALNKILLFSQVLERTAENFKKIQKELNTIKKNLR